jgi:hypothetical protein
VENVTARIGTGGRVAVGAGSVAVGVAGEPTVEALAQAVAPPSMSSAAAMNASARTNRMYSPYRRE